MKKILVLCTVFLLALVFAVFPLAETAGTYVVDGAGLLSEVEAASLQSRLKTISDSWGVDVAVVTVDSIGNYSATRFADDFYDKQGPSLGWGKDGILLLVSMESHVWAISTAGKGIDVLTESRLDTLEEDVIPYLRNGNYAGAFRAFAADCEGFLDRELSFPLLRNLLLALACGLLVAWIATASMKSKLKSVRTQAAANQYFRRDSMVVTEQRDLFLYSKVNRRSRPKPSSSSSSSSRTHKSSSGVSHGGRSGKF